MATNQDGLTIDEKLYKFLCEYITENYTPAPLMMGSIGFEDEEEEEVVDISVLVASPEKTFQEKLFEIIDERGLTGPEVYKGYISKQVFSKIQADPNYHPNKYTAIALCLSLQLNLEQTLDLIGRAGYTLSPSKKADLIVKGCIMNKEFNVVMINLILDEFHCDELKKIK